MRLVPVHAAGSIAPAGEPLSEPECQALLAHYRNGTIDSVQRWLARIEAARLWIACDCRPAHTAPPLLFVRRARPDLWVLARMTDRPRHAPSCALGGLACRPEGHDAMPRLPALAQLLFTWWEAASLNELLPYDAPDLLQAQYAALRVVSKSLLLSPGQGLFDFHRTHPQGLTALLDRMRKEALQASRGTFAVYLCVCNRLEPEPLGDSFAMAVPKSPFPNTRWEVPPIQLLPRSAVDEGPYIVLLRLCAPAGGQTLQIESAFAHPIYSHRLLVPVDGTHERHTLRLLMDVQRDLVPTKELLRLRTLLPGATAYERGVGFIAERLGPNGRVLRGVAVICASAGAGPSTPGTMNSDTLYHRIATIRSSAADQTFKAGLKRLLCGAQVRADSVAASQAPLLYSGPQSLR